MLLNFDGANSKNWFKATFDGSVLKFRVVQHYIETQTLNQRSK